MSGDLLFETIDEALFVLRCFKLECEETPEIKTKEEWLSDFVRIAKCCSSVLIESKRDLILLKMKEKVRDDTGSRSKVLLYREWLVRLEGAEQKIREHQERGREVRVVLSDGATIGFDEWKKTNEQQ